MSISVTLPVPEQARRPHGGDVLLRLHPFGNASAAPVTPLDMTGVTRLEVGPYQPAISKRVFKADGQLPVSMGFDFSFAGELNMLSVPAAELIDTITGSGWQSGGPAALPAISDPIPAGALEVIWRDRDHQSHIMSRVLPEIMLIGQGLRVEPGAGHVVIPFTSLRMPFSLATGNRLVVDRFTGDSQTTVFNLSAAPVRLLVDGVALPDCWPHPYLAGIEVRMPGCQRGNYVTDGFSLNGTQLHFTDPPDLNSIISVIYAQQIQ